MLLRTVEEKRRFKFYSLTEEEKQRILEEVKSVLSNLETVVLAVVHGGFLESKIFRDIDIAIFTGYAVPPCEAEEYIEELNAKLEEKVGIPVDVKLLDYAPPSFKLTVLSKGKVLIEKRYVSTLLRWAAEQEIKSIELKRRRVKAILRK
mgnify:CR=1 FL=1